MKQQIVSTQTRNNYLLDAALFASALAIVPSSLYFLYFPSGGYQGGRNPGYNAVVLFSRSTWDDVHTWSGIAMIVIVLAHLVLHWGWLVGMARRLWREATTGSGSRMNWHARYNVFVDALAGVSFLVVALSGIYFLFVGGNHGGTNSDPLLLFTRQTWDAIHTWSGVVMILAVVAHFEIHWRWIVKVTSKIYVGLKSKSATLPEGNQVGQLTNR